MKKTILTFGLISGILASVLMAATIPVLRTDHGSKALIIGYATIVLAALLIFFGIRSYRDNLAGGAITFGRAFTIGLGITLISCAIYVLAWEILYFNFLPHYMDSLLRRPDPASPIQPRHPRSHPGQSRGHPPIPDRLPEPPHQRPLHLHRTLPGRPPDHPDLRRHPPPQAPIPTHVPPRNSLTS